MNKKYYISLITAVLCSLIVPITFYLNADEEELEQLQIKTVYNFEYVEGAIQPIPRTMTIDLSWLALGKALFHSPLLSADNTISCASCHLVDYGGDDGFPVSVGMKSAKGTRNSPTVFNAVFNFRQFWDGRVASLEEQISGPIHNPVEMGSSWQEIIQKLNKDKYFTEKFNELTTNGITSDNIIKAITVYEQSLITPNAPIDRYLLGEETALNDQQKRGLKYFTEYGCTTCHQGRNIGGNIFQKLGRLDTVPNYLLSDLGRFESTKILTDKYMFKVPSLRNVVNTGPYFHNGSVVELSEAVKIMAKAQLARELTESEVEDIVALLASFSGEVPEVTK